MSFFHQLSTTHRAKLNFHCYRYVHSIATTFSILWTFINMALNNIYIAQFFDFKFSICSFI